MNNNITLPLSQTKSYDFIIINGQELNSFLLSQDLVYLIMSKKQVWFLISDKGSIKAMLDAQAF